MEVPSKYMLALKHIMQDITYLPKAEAAILG